MQRGLAAELVELAEQWQAEVAAVALVEVAALG